MSGFYKVVNGKLLHAPTRVYAPGYTLLLKNKNDASIPDGWKWFNNIDEAYTFFGVAVDKIKDELVDIANLTDKEEVRIKVSKLSVDLGKGTLTT
jgi:hypothetical protein